MDERENTRYWEENAPDWVRLRAAASTPRETW